jgi:hypothetical protein
MHQILKVICSYECEGKVTPAIEWTTHCFTKITNVSVKYDSKPNVNVNSLGDVQLDVTPCPIVYHPLDGIPAEEESSINEKGKYVNRIHWLSTKKCSILQL